MIPSIVGRPKVPGVMVGTDQTDSYVDDEDQNFYEDLLDQVGQQQAWEDGLWGIEKEEEEESEGAKRVNRFGRPFSSS